MLNEGVSAGEQVNTSLTRVVFGKGDIRHKPGASSIIEVHNGVDFEDICKWLICDDNGTIEVKANDIDVTPSSLHRLQLVININSSDQEVLDLMSNDNSWISN